MVERKHFVDQTIRGIKIKTEDQVVRFRRAQLEQRYWQFNTAFKGLVHSGLNIIVQRAQYAHDPDHEFVPIPPISRYKEAAKELNSEIAKLPPEVQHECDILLEQFGMTANRLLKRRQGVLPEDHKYSFPR